jgi:hypothetical protein
MPTLQKRKSDASSRSDWSLCTRKGGSCVMLRDPPPSPTIEGPKRLCERRGGAVRWRIARALLIYNLRSESDSVGGGIWCTF